MTDKMTRENFISFFAPIWELRLDLEDGLVEELKEWRDEFREMDEHENFNWLAEAVNESLESYGYPTFPIDLRNESAK